MLITDIETLITYCPVTKATTFANVKLTVDTVYKYHVLPVLGTTLAETLKINLNSTEDKYKQLLTECRMVIGQYTAYYYAPIAELKLSDAGARRSETATEKTAYQYQVTAFREECLRKGEQATEALLQLLHEKKADYPEWGNTAAEKEYLKYFIKDATTFANYFNSASPYRNYRAMRFKMHDAEVLVVQKNITPALYEHLKQKDKNGTEYTAREAELMEMLKSVIAHYTVLYALPFLNVRIDGDGLTVVQLMFTSRDADSKKAQANADSINYLAEHCRSTGESWMAAALKYIEDNRADFASYTVPASNNSDSLSERSEQLNGLFGLV